MRRNSHLSCLWIAVLAFVATGCGSGNSNSNTAPLTGLSKRVLVTNTANGTVAFVDAKKDQLNPKALAAPSGAKMLTANGTTIVMDSAGSEITIIDNATEAVTFNAPIGDQPFDIALSPDGATAWAAMRNFGFVQAVDTATGIARPVIRIGNARRLVMSPHGTKLLVFLDPQAQVQPNTHAFLVVDTATGLFQAVIDAQLDEPITGVFGTSDTQAFILNCGAECGGTASSVVSVDFSTATPVFSANVPVQGATVGLLNGTTLFVAGTGGTLPAPTGPSAACPLSRCGALTAVNTTAFTAGPAIPITDGLHETMALTSTGKLYVGAGACSVETDTATGNVRGCLSIFNTNTSTTTFPEESSFRQNFNVTSLQPITGRNVIYVVQGGALDIFDTNTDAVETGITPVDIIGNAAAAVQIDP